MRYSVPYFALFLCGCILFPISGSSLEESPNSSNTTKADMQLGNFSISLAVKDINVSKEFYEKLGFKMTGGDKQKYVILKNETSTVGLFQGMFEKNSLTFNPGWDRDCNTLDQYQDIREIQQELKKRGLNPVVAADESTTGPAFFMVVDPDGNPILIDQHVSKPAKK